MQKELLSIKLILEKIEENLKSIKFPTDSELSLSESEDKVNLIYKKLLEKRNDLESPKRSM